IRDESLALVIIPGKNLHFYTVTIVSEKISDDLVTDIAGGVVAFSPDLTIVEWNKRMTYLFGPAAENAKGRKVSEVLPNPVLYNWSSVIASAHLGHEVRVEFVPSGGTKIEGVLTQGGPGVIGLFRDSSETYEASKRLRALGRLNQAYLQVSGTGLLLLDDQLRILHSNVGFTHLSKHKGTLIGLFLHEVIAAESFQWVHDSSERLLTNENLLLSETIVYKDSEGNDRIIQQTLKALRNESNQNLNFVCIFEDKTEFTLIKNENIKLKNSMKCLSDIADQLFEKESNDISLILEEVLKATYSKAAAFYLYDHFENLQLDVFVGSWPQSYPKKDPVDYNFVSHVWGSGKIQKIAKSGLGSLSESFSNSLIIPIGSGIQEIGYLMLMNPELSETNYRIFYIIASLVRAKYSFIKEKLISAKSRLFKHSSELAPVDFLDLFHFPLAIIQLNGEIIYWNSFLEHITGILFNDVSSEDVSNLIDPEQIGLTIDSLASASSLSAGNKGKIWAVKRKDGSSTERYLWTALHLHAFSSSTRNPTFLLYGNQIRSAGYSVSEPNHEDFKLDFKKFTLLLSVTSFEAAFEAVYSLFLSSKFDGVMQFISPDNSIYLYPPGSDTKNVDWSHKLKRVIFQQDFTINISERIELDELDAVLRILSLLDLNRKDIDNAVVNNYIDKFAQGLAHYLRRFSIDSIEKNNSILQIVSDQDPLSGFARTMLFSQELAERVSHLLELSSIITPDAFRIENPNKFLPQIIKEFLSMDLLPPTLSIGSALNSVFVNPKVLLQSIGLLYQLIQLDEVPVISVENTKDNIDSGVVLEIKNIESIDLNFDIEKAYFSLLAGKFDFNTELAILLTLLQASGCSNISYENGKLFLTIKGIS
ncbi:MAG: PAS domain-containing protein, partial [Candidatus Heimdallarchaeaceae archaeon]